MDLEDLEGGGGLAGPGVFPRPEASTSSLEKSPQKSPQNNPTSKPRQVLTGDGIGLGSRTIFDHPSNLRHPEPAFVIMDPKPPFGYFGPALLFNIHHVI